MIIARVRAAYEDDIKTYYGHIIKKSDSEITIDIKTKELDDNFLKIWVSFSDNNQLNVYEVEHVDIGNNKITLRNLKRKSADSEREFHRIDYKGIFKIKKIEQAEKRKYINMVENNTLSSKSSFAKKIKSILPTESFNNQMVLKFLLEMNNKLDTIIELLKNTEIVTDLTVVNAVDISGGGLSFFTKEILNENDIIYLEGEITESYHKINVSALCKVVSIFKTPKGYIYGVNYDYIDKEIREEIIKFIFEKDRELIKGSKDK